jgi:hypothetical protein
MSVQMASGIKLLTVGNPKTIKGQARGYVTGILHLAPHLASGYNMCPMATPECIATCLNTAGRGAMSKIQQARIRRTKMFVEERQKFLDLLRADINKLALRSIINNFELAIRLNGTSDVRWENYGIIQEFPDLMWYDYTKIVNRKNLPPNYHLTFSFSGHNLEACRTALANGMSVAVPFLKPPPDKWLGHRVVDGDADDLRFIGNGPVVYALRAKGRLRKDPASKFLGENHSV